MRRKRHYIPPKFFHILPSLLSVCLVIAMLLYLDSKVRPVIESVSSYQARLMVIQYINNSITKVIEDEEIKTADVVRVTVGENGIVSSVQADMVTLNRLKADITRSISEDLLELRSHSISIPIGSLSGIQILSGRGPRIAFEVIPSSYVTSSFVGEFSTAGINQTIHRINIQIDTSVLVIVPGYSSRTEVNADFCVAETVIVGTVPEAFTEVISGELDTGTVYDFIAE